MVQNSPSPSPRKRAACEIEGARANNLKNISCRIPFGKMTAVTGVSGSGKSTLAFDILYAEGQRRFVDCLSTYARQFLQRLDRPEVDRIGEIQPPVALHQHTSIRNARSTVGSITELSNLFELVFAFAGTPHCPVDGTELREETSESAASRLRSLPAGKYVLSVPIDVPKRAAAAFAASYQEQGYSRIFEGGVVREWAAPFGGGSTQLIVDRFLPRSLSKTRAIESIESAWKLGLGRAEVHVLGESSPSLELIRGLSCPTCGHRGSTLRPQMFSSNSPLGACPTCNGFGRSVILDREKVVPDPRLSLRGGAVAPFESKTGSGAKRKMLSRAAEVGIATDIPFSNLTKEEQTWVFEGDGRYRGVEGLFQRLERKRYRAYVRIFIARYRGFVVCPDCAGTRYRSEALSVRLGGKTVSELHESPLRELAPFFRDLELTKARRARVEPVLSEIEDRLGYLGDVGLGYLTLARTGRTLSGGETQRIRLASGLGSTLTRTLYILDEPTVGLHAVDTGRMLSILKKLCETGNTVVVVEHDPGIIRGADHLIVLGPSGGAEGGELLYEGATKPFFRKHPGYFRAGGAPRRNGGAAGNGPQLQLQGIRQHNLDIPELFIPSDRLVVITGVSGSGKSTLVEDVLHKNALRHYGKTVEEVGQVRSLQGLERFEEVVLVSQNPLGRSSRSSLITYTGLLTLVRKLFARTPKAAENELAPGDFSLNVEGGRCEACKGMGTVVLEMHFMADVEVSCEVCRGRRFREAVLEVTYRGKSILQVLDLTVDEALVFFSNLPEASRLLDPLRAIGLGYLTLGQATSTLSGGEAQRLKIASLLAREGKSGERKMFILDEPTSGLHPRDISRLIGSLRELVDRGHGVIVVEHQLDFIRAADHVIDLGPGGGDAGGKLLYSGELAGLFDVGESVTARALEEEPQAPRDRVEQVESTHATS